MPAPPLYVSRPGRAAESRPEKSECPTSAKPEPHRSGPEVAQRYHRSVTLTVVVDVAPGESAPPRSGAPVVLQLRDMTYVDVANPVVAEARTRAGAHDTPLAAMQLEVPDDAPRNLGLWAHVDVDEDGRVSSGDFVSTAAYPVTASDAGSPMRVFVKRV